MAKGKGNFSVYASPLCCSVVAGERTRESYIHPLQHAACPPATPDAEHETFAQTKSTPVATPSNEMLWHGNRPLHRIVIGVLQPDRSTFLYLTFEMRGRKLPT
jgi:hypothetical protein